MQRSSLIALSAQPATEAAPAALIEPGPSAALTRIDGIPLCEVGIDWRSAGGLVTMTEKDLADAIESVATDKAILPPRFGVGHDGVWADARPAFGRYENLRLSENKQALIGDLVGIPVWLAEILPSAYPNRSIYGRKDYESDSGKTWSCVLERVDVLGVVLPAIKTLADLSIYYGKDAPAGVMLNGTLVAAGSVALSMDVDLIRRAFWHDFCTGDRYDWFLRSLRTAPDEIIAEDEDGNLWQVPFTVNGTDQTVSFGDPSRVKEEFVPAPVAASSGDPRERARYKTRDESRAGLKEDHVNPKEKLRAALGLASDATDEQVAAKQKEITDAIAAAAPQPTAEEQAAAEKAAKDKKDAEDAAAVAASASKTPDVAALAAQGLSVVDTATLETLKSGAEIALKMQAAEKSRSREVLLSAAVQQGKIPPARKEHYGKLYDADPEGTTKLLAELQAGLLPVGAALGSTLAEDGDQTSGLEGLYSQAERQRLSVAASSDSSGAQPTVLMVSE